MPIIRKRINIVRKQPSAFRLKLLPLFRAEMFLKPTSGIRAKLSRFNSKESFDCLTYRLPFTGARFSGRRQQFAY